MSVELKPCRCGENINKYFRVEEIASKKGWVIGVAYCDFCDELVAFKSRAYDFEEFNDSAVKAWNTRTKGE